MTSLLDVLGEARARGLLGPGPVEDQVRHSRALGEMIGPAPQSFLDLGSGGGIPGLVLALAWADTRAVLLDSHRRAHAFLEQAVAQLTLGDRVDVVAGRAEELARQPEMRGAFELVVARSFGRPSVTAECAVGFLRTGGRVVVSESPAPQSERWDTAGLAELGFSGAAIRRSGEATVAILELSEPVSGRWPRRTGIPAKRPLW